MKSEELRNRIYDAGEWWLAYVEVVDVLGRGLRWEVLRPMPTTPEGKGPFVPPGFVCDLGSIPAAVWWVPGLQPWGAPAPYYIHHDWNYANEMGVGDGTDSLWQSQVSPYRAEADRRLCEGVRKTLGSGYARVVNRFVRAAGGWVWYKHTPETVQAARALVEPQV